MHPLERHRSVEVAGAFPVGGTEEQSWEFVLRYAVRASSGHNTQSWRFAISDGRLHLYADRCRGLPVVDPDGRALVISCGAALAHLVVALRHFGYTGDLTPFPDPADRDLLAAVGLGRGHTPEPAAMTSCSRPSAHGTPTARPSRVGPSRTGSWRSSSARPIGPGPPCTCLLAANPTGFAPALAPLMISSTTAARRVGRSGGS